MYESLHFELGVRDVSGLVANFYQGDAATQHAIRAVVRRAGQLTKQVTEMLAPKDTLFMSQHVHTWYSAHGLAYETGWDASDFFSRGLPFYPPYQEFGTAHMRAQESLGPAYRYVSPIFAADLAGAVRGAIDRLNGGAR